MHFHTQIKPIYNRKKQLSTVNYMGVSGVNMIRKSSPSSRAGNLASQSNFTILYRHVMLPCRLYSLIWTLVRLRLAYSNLFDTFRNTPQPLSDATLRNFHKIGESANPNPSQYCIYVRIDDARINVRKTRR